MSVAAAIPKAAAARVPTRHAPVATLEIARTMAAAEADWRELEHGVAIMTPFQRFDFLNAWQRSIGEHEGREPLIVIARDEDHRPTFLLPLCVNRSGSVVKAQFLGGKHATFNMPIWRRDIVDTVSDADVAAIIQAIRDADPTIAIIELLRQPDEWRSIRNPFSRLQRQLSVNNCPILDLPPQADPTALVSASMRRRLKSKERKLQKLPGFRSYVAYTDAEIDRALEAFFRFKPARMAELNLPNVFAEPAVERFIRDGCHKELPGGGRAIQIHALACESEIIALYAGVADGERLSMMFNTYTTSENARHSPGLILIRNIIDHSARQNYRVIDLGVGDEDYKRLFCKTNQPLYDSFIAGNRSGALPTAVISWMSSVKRLIKTNTIARSLASRVRRLLPR